MLSKVVLPAARLSVRQTTAYARAAQHELPPPIGQLSEEEHQDIASSLPALATGDDAPLLQVLKELLESRVSEQEFDDYQEFFERDRRAILQRVAKQVPELAGVHLRTDGNGTP